MIAASEKYIGFHMLHKTRIKCCVRSYITYSDIQCLLLHSYVVHQTTVLFENYTTYQKILHNI